MENKGLIIGVVLIVAFLAAVPLVTKRNQTAAKPDSATATTPASATTSPAPATPAIPAPPPEPPKPKIEASLLEKLLYGMTYEQTVEVVGVEADNSESEYERDKSGFTQPVTIIWKEWEAKGGYWLRLGFVSNKLDKKEFKRKSDLSEEEKP